MIKSRTVTEDAAKSCAKCKHLGYKAEMYCKIDGLKVPDGALTISTCHKWKEVKHG